MRSKDDEGGTIGGCKYAVFCVNCILCKEYVYSTLCKECAVFLCRDNQGGTIGRCKYAVFCVKCTSCNEYSTLCKEYAVFAVKNMQYFV